MNKKESQTKNNSRSYQYQAPPTSGAEEIIKTYRKIGYANSMGFMKHHGEWVRFKKNSSGSREWFCNHARGEYYEVWSD